MKGIIVYGVGMGLIVFAIFLVATLLTLYF